jgi:LysM repeat protein
MSSRTPRNSAQPTSKPPEIDDSNPYIPEPKQGHTGSLLAFVSVLAVLGFGFWAALTTYMGTGDAKASGKTTTTPVATKAATSAPVAAPVATGVTTTPAANPSGTPSRTATAGPSGSKVHVVGDGDTLYKIAARYGTTVEAVMAANGFSDRSKILHVGDRLTIP